MKYRARALNAELEISLEREGLRLGSRFVDFADLRALIPMNHRVLLDTLAGERIEISMLGFSYDGFWEELTGLFSARNREALFLEGEPIMSVEGEYCAQTERGRGRIELYPDSVCILPPSSAAMRIPLFFTKELRQEGYVLRLIAEDGAEFTVGRMGYDTMPFAERMQKAADKTRRERAALLEKIQLQAPFRHAGLFRTTQTELSWQAACGDGCCAVELFTGEDAATYLYRYREPKELFLRQLVRAMEAMGPHREIIWLSVEQLAAKPVYRMAVDRCPAVRYLRERSAGRIIHNQTHAQRLAEFLGTAAERN